MKAYTPFGVASFCALAVIGCSRKKPAPEVPTALTTVAVASSASAAAPAASVSSAVIEEATAPADACSAVRTWPEWKSRKAPACTFRVAPNPAATPAIGWEPCPSEVGIPGCRQAPRPSQRVVARIDARRGRTTLATQVTCHGFEYVTIEQLDGKVVAGIAEGTCSPKLLDYRSGHWLLSADYSVSREPPDIDDQPIDPSLRARMYPSEQHAVVLGGVPPKLDVLWDGDLEDGRLTAGHAGAEELAFLIEHSRFGTSGDPDAWFGCDWSGPPTPITRLTYVTSAALAKNALFYEGEKGGLYVEGHVFQKQTLVPPSTEVRWVTTDENDLAFLSDMPGTKRCFLFASPAATTPDTLDEFHPRRLLEECGPLAVGCGHALIHKDDHLTLVRLKDGARATLPIGGKDSRSRESGALSCAEAFFWRGDLLSRVPLSAFGLLTPPPVAPVEVDPDHLFDDPEAIDAGAAGDASKVSDAGEPSDAGASSAPTDAGTPEDAAAPPSEKTKPSPASSTLVLGRDGG
jgi:hypothetical protein